MQFLPKDVIGGDFTLEMLSLSLELRFFLSLFISMVRKFFSSE
jgi:hypothetical protein